ncbi:MAG: ABC transporter permease [Thermoplasmatales archaeon]|nr:MAG: ABC transporter permease [Thermoplasmatales archaeon]
MDITESQAIYIMWLRQMKRFIRSRGRLVGTIVQPLFFLVILGSGLRSAVMPGMMGDDYLSFLAPGIIAMAILFSSMFTGISVLWDKQFGFLQEVLVAPVSRFSIIIGRTLGGATTALIQGFIILFIAFGLGVPIAGISGLMLTIVFMVLSAFTAVGFGLVIASKMENFQAFQLIMNLVIMPLLFLSSAFFPIATNPDMPSIVSQVSFFNPLFYMVDGIRGSLTGINNVLNPLVDLVVVLGICIFMLGLGSYLFSKSEI